MLAKEFNLDLALRAERQGGIKEGVKEVIIRMLEHNFQDDDIISVARITPEKLVQYKGLLNKSAIILSRINWKREVRELYN